MAQVNIIINYKSTNLPEGWLLECRDSLSFCSRCIVYQAPFLLVLFLQYLIPLCSGQRSVNDWAVRYWYLNYFPAQLCKTISMQTMLSLRNLTPYLKSFRIACELEWWTELHHPSRTCSFPWPFQHSSPHLPSQMLTIQHSTQNYRRKGNREVTGVCCCSKLSSESSLLTTVRWAL